MHNCVTVYDKRPSKTVVPIIGWCLGSHGTITNVDTRPGQLVPLPPPDTQYTQATLVTINTALFVILEDQIMLN